MQFREGVFFELNVARFHWRGIICKCVKCGADRWLPGRQTQNFPQICVEILYIKISGNDQGISAISAGYMRSMHIRMRSRTSGSRKFHSASLSEHKIQSLISNLSTELQASSSEINAVLSPADVWNKYPQYYTVRQTSRILDCMPTFWWRICRLSKLAQVLGCKKVLVLSRFCAFCT